MAVRPVTAPAELTEAPAAGLPTRAVNTPPAGVSVRVAVVAGAQIVALPTTGLTFIVKDTKAVSLQVRSPVVLTTTAK